MRTHAREARVISDRLHIAALSSAELPSEPLRAARAARRLALLYRSHWVELRTYVRRKFGPGPPEPEDIIQAVFARLSGRGGLDDVANPRAFLYRVAHNVAIEEHRREHARARRDEEASPMTREDTDDRDPERVSIGRQTARLMEIAFASLEPRVQQILIMSRQDELSSAEIARRTGLSQTQVKRLLGEAIVRCRAFVENPDGGGEP